MYTEIVIYTSKVCLQRRAVSDASPARLSCFSTRGRSSIASCSWSIDDISSYGVSFTAGCGIGGKCGIERSDGIGSFGIEAGIGIEGGFGIIGIEGGVGIGGSFSPLMALRSHSKSCSCLDSSATKIIRKTLQSAYT